MNESMRRRFMNMPRPDLRACVGDMTPEEVAAYWEFRDELDRLIETGASIEEARRVFGRFNGRLPRTTGSYQ